MASANGISALKISLVAVALLTILGSSLGDEPTYKDCRPHIDATIRDLASKALNAGEEPLHDSSEDFSGPVEGKTANTIADSDVSDQQDTQGSQTNELPEQKIDQTPGEPKSEPVVPASIEKEVEPQDPIPSNAEPEVEEQEEEPTPIVVPAELEEEPSSVATESVPVEQPAEEKIDDVPASAPEVEIPSPPPVPQKEFETTTPAPSTPVYTPPPSENIINKFIYAAFGPVKEERDSKWADPWQSHYEHKRAPVEEKKVIFDGPGVIGKSINKFVYIIFGESFGERDGKWAQPWQSHEEHRSKPISSSQETVKETYVHVPKDNVINKVITLLFGEAQGPRDPKYADHWQSHPEHQRKFDVVKEPRDKENIVAVASGGIIDKLIKLVFPSPLGERDSKYAKPWQSHSDTNKIDRVEEVPEKQEKAEAIGGPIDRLIKLLFYVEDAAERDPKYAQPWQTHPEHSRKESPSTVKEKPTPVQTGGLPGFGFLDKFVTMVFGTPNGVRDEKWSRHWQTHSEHKIVPSVKTEEKKVVGASGGMIDSLIKSLFGISQESPRGTKWSQPWQSHDDSTPIVPTPPTSEVTSPPTPAPAPQTPSAPAPPPPSAPASPPATAPSPPPVAAPPPPSEAPKKIETIPEEPKQKFPDTKDSGDSEVDEDSSEDKTSDVGDIPEASASSQEEASSLEEDQDDDEDEQIVFVPSSPRNRDHIDAILGLDSTSSEVSKKSDPIVDATLKNLKNIYASNVKPLEETFKYMDISNRHMSDAQIFGQPLVLLLGPYSTGKSSFLNYLMGIEYTRRALRTGANPSHGVFRIIQYGSEDQELDGTALSADWSFRSLQKFGQNFIDQLRGNALDVPLLRKVTFVEAPGILEMRRAGERLYPFNDVLQWFIDRADLVLVMFDYTKLDAGYELEAALDQLKGREAQVRILLNKADQIPPEELIKVQGSLFWNLSPLLGAAAPPTVYAGSFSSRPYRTSSPGKLFQAQEEALLHDISKAINNRVDNRVAITRRHAVRVRNHAQMIDTYLATYNKNKGFLTSKHKLADDIVENPHLYNIYEGMSLSTNISRYDLPDPEVYRDFFRVYNLYDFPTLKGTCTYLNGCPLDKIDKAISVDLPELLAKYRRQLNQAGLSAQLPEPVDLNEGRTTLPHPHQSKL